MELIDFLEKINDDNISKGKYIDRIADPKAKSGWRYIYTESDRKKKDTDESSSPKSTVEYDGGIRTYDTKGGGTLKVYGMENGKYIVSDGDHKEKKKLSKKEIAMKYG